MNLDFERLTVCGRGAQLENAWWYRAAKWNNVMVFVIMAVGTLAVNQILGAKNFTPAWWTTTVLVGGIAILTATVFIILRAWQTERIKQHLAIVALLNAIASVKVTGLDQEAVEAWQQKMAWYTLAVISTELADTQQDARENAP